MLGRFLKQKQSQAAAPPGERLYAIGDIHGCNDLLDRLLTVIDAEDSTAQKRLIFLGDYVDRGPDSRGVLDRLCALKQRPIGAAPVFLKGNHEAAMMNFLNAPRQHEEWLSWGGEKTLASYRIDGAWRRTADDLAQGLNRNLPDNHRQFLDDLSLTKEAGDYLFVHAGVKPGVPLENQSEDDLLWIREEFHNTPADLRPTKIIVHGHQPTKKPVDKNWRIGVDTGAAWWGKLTAVVLEGEERRFLSVCDQ